MVNILPPQALRGIRRFYWSRLLVVGSLAAILCGIIASFAFMPAYAIVHFGNGSGDELAQAEASPTSSTERQDIADAQILLKELRDTASSTPSSVAFIEAALSARPAGIRVDTIHLTDEANATLVVGGIASSREAINAYRTALSGDPHFASVTVPIGILAGTEDGRFTITLTGKL